MRIYWMAVKRTIADLDLSQEEKQLQDTSRRPSFPAAYTSSSNAFGPEERQAPISLPLSRSARTLPLPSPTWTSPSRSFPIPQLPSTWELAGSLAGQQQSPEQFFPPAPKEHNNLSPVQDDYGSVAKKESASPLSPIYSDEAAQTTTGDSARPESERQHLKAKIGNLQAQVEDLHRQLDLVKQHAATKDAQYLQIIEHSTQREQQGVADGQRWRADRQQWTAERQALQETIAGLNSSLGELRRHYSQEQGGRTSADSKNAPQTASLSPQGAGETNNDYFTQLVTHPFHHHHHPNATGTAPTLRREPPSRTGTPLDHLQYQSGQLAEYSARLGDIGRNIRMQLDLMRDAVPPPPPPPPPPSS